MSLGAAYQVFFTIKNQFYGPTQVPSQKSCMAGNQRGEILFSSKASSGCGLNDADLIFRNAQNLAYSVMNVKWALHGAIYGN